MIPAPSHGRDHGHGHFRNVITQWCSGVEAATHPRLSVSQQAGPEARMRKSSAMPQSGWFYLMGIATFAWCSSLISLRDQLRDSVFAAKKAAVQKKTSSLSSSGWSFLTPQSQRRCSNNFTTPLANAEVKSNWNMTKKWKREKRWILKDGWNLWNAWLSWIGVANLSEKIWKNHRFRHSDSRPWPFLQQKCWMLVASVDKAGKIFCWILGATFCGGSFSNATSKSEESFNISVG